jgi:hypothetical protein
MQALDNFISPVPGFNGDILIMTILVLAWPPSDKPMSDPFAEASASTLKTRVGKRKATVNATPQKKARKTTGRSAGGILVKFDGILTRACEVVRIEVLYANLVMRPSQSASD